MALCLKALVIMFYSIYFIHGPIPFLMPLGWLFQCHIPIGFSIRCEFAAYDVLTVKENENALLPAIFIN